MNENTGNYDLSAARTVLTEWAEDVCRAVKEDPFTLTQALMCFVDMRKRVTVGQAKNLIFRLFHYCKYDTAKMVIILNISTINHWSTVYQERIRA